MGKTARIRLSFRSSLRPLAALGLGLGLTAMQAPGTASDAPARPIIVTGEPLPEPMARDRAIEFLRGTRVAIGETPVARWVDPVCPRVLGLAPEGARAAEATMRSIAVAAGIEVAAEPCDSNIVVMFTPDAAAIVRQVARREPRRLEEVDPVTRQALVSGSAPVRWWHTSETRARHSGDGRSGTTSAARMTGIGRGATGRGAGSDMTSDVPTMMHYENSIISTLTIRSLISATVVIDQDAVMGRRLSQIAAYAALVAFAEIRPGDFGPDGSILGMFGAANPQGLTSQDMGFLQALYRLPLDRQARLQRGLLVGGMVGATTGRTLAQN